MPNVNLNANVGGGAFLGQMGGAGGGGLFDGDIWMDKRQVNLPEVRGLIERLHVERPDDTVVLIADRDAETGTLTKVMDQVKLGGVKDVSIATAPSGG